LRLLSWNLFHGRDRPPAAGLGATHTEVNRSLRAEFLAKLAGWEWDVALLQEAPPRWFADFRSATGAAGARALTSRNCLAPIRGAIAEWRPDLIGANEGGSNVLLVRPPARIAATGRMRVALWPERRVALFAELELRDGRRLVVANVHLSVPKTGRGAAEALRAAEAAVRRTGGDPVVLGGDLNLRASDHPAAFDSLRERFGLAAPTGPEAIDHLLVRGLEPVEPPRRLPGAERDVPGPDGLAIRLSDHAPVVGAFRLR
jgi:endonuclease/exonuclease/phosphatase family metal-dependent hydrolase